MIYLMISVASWWLVYKAFMRITEDSFSGTITGIFFFVVSGFSFIVGGWWSLIGYGLFIYAAAAYFQPLIDSARTGSTAPQREPLARIEFSYRDARGNDSRRKVDVEAIDGEYFEGFCHRANATRTFVIGRVKGSISNVDTGELLPPTRWAEIMRKNLRNDGVVVNRGDRLRTAEQDDAGKQVEILFTGFSKAQRAELEELAELYDMTVRKSVTEGLNYLVAGPNAGPAKLAQAAEVGVDIIDLDEFMELTRKIP